VKCYEPGFDTWRSVLEMSVYRNGVDIRVMDGVMYAMMEQWILKVLRFIDQVMEFGLL